MKFITWRQKLGKSDCPYMERWVLDFKIFSIRIHKWICGDDPRHFHDHPWSFYGIVLRGSYYDVTPDGEELMSRGKVFFRDSSHKHTVKTNGCITLIITGPIIRKWGFYVFNKSGKEIWFKARRYFFTYGHHQCE